MSQEEEFTQRFQNRLDQIAQLSNDSSIPSLSVEGLVDAVIALYTDCKELSSQTEHVQKFIKKYDKIMTKVQSLRINTNDFEVVQTLATGAVGKVCLVKEKRNNKVYAMKILKKSDLLSRREAQFFMEERDALVFAQSSVWLTTLYAAFQDVENLYLVMEYASGGSLRTMISNREETMGESEARFYVAEIMLSLEELHKFDFIHRDVKPENCLIDATGHIKLADFGSCMRVDDEKRITSGETVGTPDYICPEILRAHEGNVSYGQSCDWWSLGIILYELLFDEVPFYSESLMETYGKIMDHEKHFAFPDDIKVSETVTDLMKKLICKQHERLGNNGAGEIKKHSWFEGVDFVAIRTSNPPFVPDLKGPDDTRYFEDEEDESKKVAETTVRKGRDYAGNSLPFIGYTYVQDAKPIIKLIGENGKFKDGSPSTTSPTTEPQSSASKPPKIDDSQLNTYKAEISALKSRVEEHSAYKTQMDEKFSALGKEKALLESEYKQIKLDKKNSDEERLELEQKLNNLKKSLDNEINSNLELRQSCSSNIELEKQIKTLREQLEAEKLNSNTHGDAVSETSKLNNLLKLEVQQNQRTIKESDSTINSMKEEIEALRKNAQSFANSREEAQSEIKLLQSKLKDSKAIIGESEEKLKSIESQISTSKETITHLEKDKAISTVEIKSLQNKISEYEAEKKSLSALLAEREKPSNTSTASAGMKTELEKLRAQLSDLSKENDLLEIEFKEISKRLKEEVSENTENKAKLQLLEKKSSKTEHQISELLDEKAKLQLKVSQCEKDMGAAELKSQENKSALNDMQLRSASLEKAQAVLSNDLEDIKSKHARELINSANLQEKITKLEESLVSERRLKIQAESTLRSTDGNRGELEQELVRLQNKLSSLKDEQNKSYADQQNLELKLKTLVAEHALVLEHEHKGLLKLEKTNENLERALNAATTKLQEKIDEVTKIKEKINIYIQANEDLELQLSNEVDNSSRLLSRVTEAELLLATVNNSHHALEDKRTSSPSDVAIPERGRNYKRMSDFGSFTGVKILSRSIDVVSREREGSSSTTGGSTISKDPASDNKFKNATLGLFSQMKSKNIFSKSKEERERATQKIEDAQNEQNMLKSPSQHYRHESYGSMSAKSGNQSFNIQVDLSGAGFNAAEGLKGWLKMPKQGKVKKGWKKVYGIVKEYNFYAYEKEKDADDPHGVPIEIINLRSDIFYVKTVTQAELIHANSKDIDAIFKIHFANRVITSKDNHATKSGSSINSQSDVLKAGSVSSAPKKPVFKLKASDTTSAPKPSSDKLAEIADVHKRISQLQAYIALEEKYLLGAQTMLNASTTDNLKQMANQQLDIFNKNIKEWKAQLDSLISAHNATLPALGDQLTGSLEGLDNIATIIFDQDYKDWTKQIEQSLAVKYQEKEALLKLISIKEFADKRPTASNVGQQPQKTNTSAPNLPSAGGKDIDGELGAIEKEISRLKEEQEIFKSKDRTKINTLLKSLNERAALAACNGHYFKKKILHKPLDCAHCREALWLQTDGVKTVMECEVCKANCHSYCKVNFDVTCHDYVELKNVSPLYFMAVDNHDRNRWINGISYFLKENEKEKLVGPMSPLVPIVRASATNVFSSKDILPDNSNTLVEEDESSNNNSLRSLNKAIVSSHSKPSSKNLPPHPEKVLQNSRNGK